MKQGEQGQIEGSWRCDRNRMDLRLGKCSGEEAAWDGFCQRSIGDLISKKYPMLYLTLPALECLHAAWSKCLIYNARYNAFQGPLAASVAKIAKHYNQTKASDAYIMGMGIFPIIKWVHITHTYLYDSYPPRVQTCAL